MSRADTKAAAAHEADADFRLTNAYFLRLLDDSMHPSIRRGEKVAVDPDHRCVVGEFVALKLRDGRGLLRELVSEGEAEIVVEATNGNKRLTIAKADIETMHAVTCIFKGPPFTDDDEITSGGGR